MTWLAKAGAQTTSAWNSRRIRRRAYAAVALLLMVLCVLPRPYVARAKMVPQDSNSVGLGSTMGALGGQFQGFAALLGGARQPIDMYLAIGRSAEVTGDVIKRLRLIGPDGYSSERKARLALASKVDVHSLTGGIIEIEVRTHDGKESMAIARAYAQAISQRILALDHDRIERKRQIVQGRFRQASERVVQTETALNAYRRRNRLAQPEAELGSAIALRTGLEARLQARMVELQTLSRFQGPDNPQLRAIQSEIATLRTQIARTAEPAMGSGGPNVAGISEASGEYLNLYRDYRFAQALYEVYSRSSEEVAVEALAGETAADVQAIEAANLDPDFKVNIPAAALLALVIALAAFTEIYAPATGVDLRIRSRGDAKS